MNQFTTAWQFGQNTLLIPLLLKAWDMVAGFSAVEDKRVERKKWSMNDGWKGGEGHWLYSQFWRQFSRQPQMQRNKKRVNWLLGLKKSWASFLDSFATKLIYWPQIEICLVSLPFC